MAMEVNPTLAASSLDVSNAIGEIERECIEAAIRADTYMHRLLPLFELLYKHGEGVLWYYDENGKFVVGVRNRRGFRQGCVLGMFLFCVTMQPIYARLQEAVGEEGALYTYCDDSYLLAPAEQMATTLREAPGIFAKVGLRIGYGPGKTKLILPRGCSREAFPLTLDDPQVPAPHVVAGFKSCLGVPRHFENDPAFIHEALQNIGHTHDRLLDLTEEIADEDPFAALRLLQTCGINRFGHVLSAVPPPLVAAFARERDEAVATTFATIQQSPL